MNPYLFLHLSSDGIEIQPLNLHMQITKESYFILIKNIVFLRFYIFERNLKLPIKYSLASNFQSQVNSVSYK